MKNKRSALRSSPHLRRIRSAVRRQGDSAVQLAERVGDLAELAMREFQSAEAVERFLAERGFSVSRPWDDIPTAFHAAAGAGKPTIAILAEYDALPDCGPRPGRTGHGCGHNLLGAASALAGVAAAETLARAGKAGRVIVFGTPAEEALAGKELMATRGAFKGLDAVLGWHPNNMTRSNGAGGSAMDSIRFTFRGRTAHAAAYPHKGRSALDAAVLTDVAVNYLREHIQPNARIHCVIPHGGKLPNVVPDRAEIWYFVRGRDRRQVDDLRRRVTLCARGAATATETRYRAEVIASITERVPNEPLAEMLDAMLHRFGPPEFTAADLRAARRVWSAAKYDETISPILREPYPGSSDEDNVSWLAPLGRIDVACVPKGTVAHHRRFAELVRTSGAHRGMLRAAEILAAAVVELVLNPPLLQKAKAEFRRNMRGRKYDLPARTAQ